jgi:hypothetical protein
MKTKQLTRAELHKVEMDLVYLCEENKLTREDIIDKFTDLMYGLP